VLIYHTGSIQTFIYAYRCERTASRSPSMLLTQQKTFLLIVSCIIFHTAASRSDTRLEPWKYYPSDCGSYDQCVEVDFQQVPPSMEGSGADSSFSDKFLLAAQEGPEEGSDSCTKPDVGTTKCLFAKENVRVQNGTLQLLVPGHFKPNETITVAQVTRTK
jgi:hypothetical protein